LFSRGDFWASGRRSCTFLLVKMTGIAGFDLRH
jgi:hypothetical protein